MDSGSELNVAVLGLGYIGLPTAAVIARTGAKVLGIDVHQHVVDTINAGKVHIEEVDLDGLVSGVIARGTLRASTQIEESDVFLIAVPTPFGENHAPNIGYVLQAATSIATVLKAGDIVILESTSPVGTTEKVAELLNRLRPDLKIPGHCTGIADVAIAYCPERVLPGRILVELIDNDRVVGGVTPRCARKALQFYRRFVRGACVTTSARAAEMTKLTENAFRDVNIAFANELSIVADGMGIDVWEVIRLANRHPRVNILSPGPGVGGHCIAVDPWFLVAADRENTPLIRTAREVNDGKPHFVAGRIAEAASAHAEPVIACLGLAFKPDIDDLRESPAVEIVHMLAQQKIGRLLVVEPHVEQLPPELASLPNISLVSAQEALAQAQVVAMLVNHRAFYGITKAQLGDKRVIDTRGVWQ